MAERAARWTFLAGGVAAAALLVGAGLCSWPSERASPAERRPAPPAAEPTRRTLPEVRTLLEQPGSAYHARLFADDNGLVLVTQNGFTTFQPDGALREHVVSLGPVVARSGDTLVFWRSGSLREVSISGGPERELAAVPRAPRYLLTSGRQIAWIHTDRETGTSLHALSGGHARVVHESAYDVSACVFHDADIYWVAAHDSGAWAIERIGLEGTSRSSSSAFDGRLPAMLAVGDDGVYFYAGPQRGVRRLTFDIQRESSVLAGVFCSPFAVSERVVCAQVGGLFEIPLFGATPRFLASERAGPVTAVAATRSHGWWVAEKGADRLLVQSVTLPEP